MDQISSLAKQIINAYPHISFEYDSVFRWTPDTQTIYYTVSNEKDIFYLLHEIAHAKLNHTAYDLDVELLRIEQEAWHYAQTILSKKYSVAIPEVIISEALDSYRNWIHERSRCPQCAQNCIQSTNGTYSCHLCNIDWRANEARNCALRRYVVN